MTRLAPLSRLFALLLPALLALALCADADAAKRGTGLSRQAIQELVTEYYNTKSEWAGTFTLVAVQKLLVEELDADHVNAHVAYKYAAVPGNRAGRRDSGYDQRVFALVRRGDHWVVTGMGAHLSGGF